VVSITNGPATAQDLAEIPDHVLDMADQEEELAHIDPYTPTPTNLKVLSLSQAWMCNSCVSIGFSLREYSVQLRD
jgi:hypothetical protein